ncbi:MAG: ABC transporter permease [Chloroflexi bacterium]|nr:ABC transporter permease [Chloroflexota bacterium]
MMGSRIRTLVAKDLALYFKNRFFAFVTLLGLAVFIGVYFLLPRTVDEALTFGIYAPVMPPALALALEDEGVVLESQPSEDALKAAVAAGDFQAGIVLPADLTEQIAANARPQVRLYLASGLPEEFRGVYQMFVREVAFLVGGQPLAIETQEEVLGPDMVGQQIAPRRRMLPLLAVFTLFVEMLGLASLISSEVEAGTLRAILVTPVRLPDVFLSKGLVGVGLAFAQAVVLMAVTGGLAQQPLLVLAALFLGAVLVTGMAFLVSSVARDFMSVIGWGMLAFIVLAIPGLAVALPGLVSGWVRVVPSYYLVDTVHRVVNFGAGWGDVAVNLAALAAFSVGVVALGMAALQRRYV